MFAIVMCIYASRLLFFFCFDFASDFDGCKRFPGGFRTTESGEMFVYSPPPPLFVYSI